MSGNAKLKESGITRAVRIVGGQAALAQQLNEHADSMASPVSQQSVSEWVRKGYVPPGRALEVSECVKNRVAPVDLLNPVLRHIVTSCAAQQTAQGPNNAAPQGSATH